MATPVMESYLETIYNLTMEEDAVIAARLAERFHITPPTVSETLSRMAKQGLITLDAKKNIHLTDDGRTLAESGLRRHRLLERMLVDMFGLDWTEAHEEAHRLEHGLSPMLEERMLTVMGSPETCPHGNPIPAPGRNPTRYLADLGARRLTGVTVGEDVAVVCISEVVEDESALLRYLGDRHIRPGAQMTVRGQDHEHGVRARLDGQDVDIAAAVADKIWVRSAA
jgi:DtxR family transcriptional regulator, Mn-dependent transcriptional regulator